MGEIPPLRQHHERRSRQVNSLTRRCFWQPRACVTGATGLNPPTVPSTDTVASRARRHSRRSWHGPRITLVLRPTSPYAESSQIHSVACTPDMSPDTRHRDPIGRHPSKLGIDDSMRMGPTRGPRRALSVRADLRAHSPWSPGGGTRRRRLARPHADGEIGRRRRLGRHADRRRDKARHDPAHKSTRHVPHGAPP